MPGFDGTGPMGAGPMTGGARGYCNPSGRYVGAPRYGLGRGFRGGFGRGGGGRGARGYGRGLGWQGDYAPAAGGYGPAYAAPYGNPYPMNPDNEMAMLRDEANAIKNELDAINKRIEELEARPSAS